MVLSMLKNNYEISIHEFVKTVESHKRHWKRVDVVIPECLLKTDNKNFFIATVLLCIMISRAINKEISELMK